MQDNPHLINVRAHRLKLQKQCDDILWEYGTNDPRLPAVISELHHFTKLDNEGVLYEPTF